MLAIRKALENEFERVKKFYNELIDAMQDAVYKPGWQKGIYPSDAYLLESICRGELYLGELEGRIVAAMIVNHESNEGYHGVQWETEAKEDEVSLIHALGVNPAFSRRGGASCMAQEVLSMARQSGQKAVRLDVLSGNVAAEKLYAGIGFQHITTVQMFYEDTGWTDFLLYEYLI